MDTEQTARVRATELLRLILPEKEWLDFQETAVIEVRGLRGLYRISAYDSTEILNPGAGHRIASACLQLSIPAPVQDRMIAEYLLIRNAEDLYWTTANIFKPQSGDSAVVLMAVIDILLLGLCVLQIVT